MCSHYDIFQEYLSLIILLIRLSDLWMISGMTQIIPCGKFHIITALWICNFFILFQRSYMVIITWWCSDIVMASIYWQWNHFYYQKSSIKQYRKHFSCNKHWIAWHNFANEHHHSPIKIMYVTGSMKIDHMSANYTELYFC